MVYVIKGHSTFSPLETLDSSLSCKKLSSQQSANGNCEAAPDYVTVRDASAVMYECLKTFSLILELTVTHNVTMPFLRLQLVRAMLNNKIVPFFMLLIQVFS